MSGLLWALEPDVARESADVVLIGNDLDKFVETVRIARNRRRIIFQNFWGTVIVDTVGIGLAAVGILNPLLATFIHVTSELIFIPSASFSREGEGKKQGAKSRTCKKPDGLGLSEVSLHTVALFQISAHQLNWSGPQK